MDFDGVGAGWDGNIGTPLRRKVKEESWDLPSFFETWVEAG